MRGQRVADRRAVTSLIAGVDPAHFAGAELVELLALGREHADVVDFVRAAGRHHQQLVAGLDLALHDAHQRHHAEVIVEPGIDDQRLQPVGIARLRRRNAGDDRLQHLDHVEAGLGADRTASVASMPMTASISSLYFSMSAVGRSILLMTGTTSSPCSTAV
jgi:hypothetical protein